MKLGGCREDLKMGGPCGSVEGPDQMQFQK